MPLAALLRLIRPHQWVKNLLVFAPVFFSGQWRLDLLLASLEAFVAFTLVAAAGYCINDLADRGYDRNHPEKSSRPIASGEVTTLQAAALIGVLTLAAFAVAVATATRLPAILAAYLGVQVTYTLLLRQLPIVDLLALSVTYVLRVLAGGAATGIVLSSWIVTITWLLAFTVVVGKRYLELSAFEAVRFHTRPVLSQYSTTYLQQLLTLSTSAALLCYLLWCHEKSQLSHIDALRIFPSSLFVAFGVFRYLQRVLAGQFPEDPARGIVTDPQIVGALVGFAVYLAVVLYTS
jgi:4-hydroxybenzoate polyprenyltransferase